MPSKLISDSGAYNYRSFKGPKGEWTIVSSKCQTNYGPWKCVDTFKGPKGALIDMKREDLRDLFDQKKIEVVESSKI